MAKGVRFPTLTALLGLGRRVFRTNPIPEKLRSSGPCISRIRDKGCISSYGGDMAGRFDRQKINFLFRLKRTSQCRRSVFRGPARLELDHQVPGIGARIDGLEVSRPKRARSTQTRSCSRRTRRRVNRQPHPSSFASRIILTPGRYRRKNGLDPHVDIFRGFPDLQAWGYESRL